MFLLRVLAMTGKAQVGRLITHLSFSHLPTRRLNYVAYSEYGSSSLIRYVITLCCRVKYGRGPNISFCFCRGKGEQALPYFSNFLVGFNMKGACSFFYRTGFISVETFSSLINSRELLHWARYFFFVFWNWLEPCLSVGIDWLEFSNKGSGSVAPCISGCLRLLVPYAPFPIPHIPCPIPHSPPFPSLPPLCPLPFFCRGPNASLKSCLMSSLT